MLRRSQGRSSDPSCRSQPSRSASSGTASASVTEIPFHLKHPPSRNSLHTMTDQGIRDWKCWPSMRHPDRLELLMGPLEVAGLGLPQAAFCPTLLLPPLSLQVWPWANPLMHILHKKHCLKECASRRTKHATPTNIIDLWVDCSKRTPQKSSENKVPFCRFRNLHKPGKVTPVLEGQTRSLLSS